MFCARLFICALWSPAGKGLTSWLSFVVSSVSLSLSLWYPGSGVVLDCIDSWSLHHYLLLICMQSCQSLHCSRTYTKWVCLWHILSFNVQTSLSMRAVSPETLLLSHMRKMGLHTAYYFSQCSDEPYCVCSLARAFTALAHTQNGRTYDIFFSQCSDGTKYACSLARAFTALEQTQNGCVYGIFYQSMFK